MLKEMIDQSRTKENQDSDESSSHQPSLAIGGKPDEDFQTIEHHEADDDSEFETEEEEEDEEDGDGHGVGPAGSMFENLLRSHGLLGPRGVRAQQEASARDALHPFTQVLSTSNVDDCVAIENASFPEAERASREKLEYRLSKCPELTFGVFSRPTLSSPSNQSSPQRSQLVAHLIATGTISPTVTDASMGVPVNWKSNAAVDATAGEETSGHQEKFRTVAVHSLAVLPEHRDKKIGSMLMLAFIERIKTSRVADRIALLAHGELVSFYEKLGFKNSGESKVQFGGGNWVDMVLEFDTMTGDDDE